MPKRKGKGKGKGKSNRQKDTSQQCEAIIYSGKSTPERVLENSCFDAEGRFNISNFIRAYAKLHPDGTPIIKWIPLEKLKFKDSEKNLINKQILKEKSLTIKKNKFVN